MFRLHMMLGVCVLAMATPALSDDQRGLPRIVNGVADANRKVQGVAADVDVTGRTFSVSPDAIANGFKLDKLVTGTDPIENPSGVIQTFGTLADPSRTLTESDENLYLVLPRNPGGPTPDYDYGRRFLFQGHEIFGQDLAFITRVNLDVKDPLHRITLLTPVQADGKTHINDLDGSAYDPFTNTLLFSEETSGRIIQLSTTWPVKQNTLEAHIGLGGYEGIKIDDKGNVYIAEDTGGASSNNAAFVTSDGQTVSLVRGRQPNSFIYRFLPRNPGRLEDGGVLQALQVIIDGKPVVFGGTTAAARDADIASVAQLKLHTPNTRYAAKWVTVHTSEANATASFDANAAAKAAGATPFKRPENIAWQPGSNFRTFYFTPTGDTNAIAGNNPFLQARGSYGSIFRVDLRSEDEKFKSPTADDAQISLFFLGDHDHNSFDNIAFANTKQVLAAEDRGDTLHNQLNTLDSIWSFDIGHPRAKPIRFVALGLDAIAATRGDNEPTGLFFSNGSTSKKDLLGTLKNLEEARSFFTHQHGENTIYEIFPSKVDKFGPLARQ